MRSIAVLVALAACGDNKTLGTDATGDDAPPNPNPRAVVVAGDFTAGHPGVLSVLDVTTRKLTQNAAPAGSVGDDPVLRKYGDELFIVNRTDGDNVTILAASDLSLVEQLGTGTGSNPQDVVIKGDKLYVPVFGGAGVAVLTRGSSNIATIDLSADDPDRKPNCISAALVGDDLYVVCELLNDNTFKARGPGKVYVIDTGTDTVRTSLTLTYKNPFGALEVIPGGLPMAGDLVIPTVGDYPYQVSVGCVERITPGATPVAAGCLPTDADMQAIANRLTFQSLGIATQVMWIAAAAPDFSSQSLRAYDLQARTLWQGPVSAPSEAISDVAVCPNEDLVLCDSTTNATGLRLYEGTSEVTTSALATGVSFCSSHGLVCY
jgi:hypothetical protein